MMIFGLLLLMAAFMIDSQNAMWPDIGTALGAVSALIGAVDSVVLLNFTGGLYEKAITGPYNVPQLAVFYVLLIGAVFVVLFVALPLGLVGSIRMFHGETVQSPEQS